MKTNKGRKKKRKKKIRKVHLSGRQYIQQHCLKYFQKTKTTPSGWYRGTVLNVRHSQKDKGSLEYLISYPCGSGQYNEWVSGECMGQSLQFWKDKKDAWIDPLACQSVESGDERVDVSSKSSAAPSNRDDTDTSSDGWNIDDRLDRY